MAGGKKDSAEDSGYVVLRSERRKALRKQILVLKVRAMDERGVFFGYAKTIGTGGMFISSVNPRNVGEEFDITFSIPGQPEPVRAKCEVAWRREYDPKVTREPGMGIKFVELDHDTKRKIEEWVASEKF